MTSRFRMLLFAGLAAWLAVNLVSGMAGKQSTRFAEDGLWLWAAACLIGVCACMGFQVLLCLFLGKRFQLSYFYPFLSVNYVFSCFIGTLCFGEPLRWGQVIGACVILAGTIILGLSPDALERRP